MSFAHFDALFTFVAAGFGLFLAGALNLAFGRGGRRVWLRLVVTLVVCVGVLGGLSALIRPELAFRAAPVLFGVLFAATALGSEWFGRILTALIAHVREPGLRWGLVALGGLVVIVGAGIAFEMRDEEVISQGMHNLDLAVGKPPTQPVPSAHAATDRGNQIVLKEPVARRDQNELAVSEAKILRDAKFSDQVIRHGAPQDETNCHGWVFTGGKFLLAPEDVELIIKENGYTETPEPQPGDLVIYRQNGTISHSAVVRYVTEGRPVLVEGKWGTMGVFLHAADKSVYGTEYTFYRSARTGHLLVGFGGSPAPAGSVPASAATE